jgi:hypothetical protein
MEEPVKPVTEALPEINQENNPVTEPVAEDPVETPVETAPETVAKAMMVESDDKVCSDGNCNTPDNKKAS